jgi:uncharacterized membrane protein
MSPSQPTCSPSLWLDLFSLTFIGVVLTGDMGVALIHVIENIANEMGYTLEHRCFDKVKNSQHTLNLKSN